MEDHWWPPCSKLHQEIMPVTIVRAEEAYFYLSDGRKIIDGISSWWCKNLGHQHPALKSALLTQANQFEHVMLANTRYDILQKLSRQLTELLPPLTKVFYASDGSSAVEIAMKMSMHWRFLQGESHRTQLIALSQAYHGETLGALSVSDLGLYKKPYTPFLQPCYFLQNVPYVNDIDETTSLDFNKVTEELAPFEKTATLLIVEPIVQGAAGMKIYHPSLLTFLRNWCDEHNVHLIADEIMTGLYRTGKMFASQQAGIVPDFMCLSKGLTGGYMPMSAVLVKEEIYAGFYQLEKQGAFLHSHTYSGHALSASVAHAALLQLQDPSLQQYQLSLNQYLKTFVDLLQKEFTVIKNPRVIGAIAAFEINNLDPKKIVSIALSKGAWLRPIGNTLYWLPPLNIRYDTLAELAHITMSAIHEVLKQSS